MNAFVSYVLGKQTQINTEDNTKKKEFRDNTEVSVFLYYRGRECMNFGIFGTKRTVGNTEVSIL